jgi:simple sugar transport system ATP-binding protein
MRSPRAATTRGIAFCSENRRTEGLVEELTVRENIVLALQAARGWLRPIPREKQDELVDRYVRALRISPANPEQVVRTLSGGNQQKVLLARWLITQPRLLILDEPTRGIDVGAKAEIQKLVVSLSDDGMAVLFISAELEEVLRLSHNIAVLRDRKVVAELVNDDSVTVDRLVEAIATGGAA